MITEYHASGRNSKIEKTNKLNSIGDAMQQISGKLAQVEMRAMPILASDAYPGKQISLTQSKKSAIMFSKTDSANLNHYMTSQPDTVSPSTKTVKPSPSKH